MSDFDKWPAQMRQLIEAFEQVLHGQSGIPFATLLTEATRDLEALESEGAHLAEAELETKLANRTSEYTTWRSKVDAAQALGLAGIEARASALTAEQNNLDEQNLPHVQAVIADFREKGLTAVAHQQTIEETIQRQQKRLRELEQEKASLATQEKKLQQQLAEWEKKKHLRQLRQDCLQTAEALHDLRQTLQQQVQANNHP
jgi:chromosome segregation ATPase